jgi:hypothetical protein
VPLTRPSGLASQLHYRTQFKELPWYYRQRTAGEIALLAERLYLAGYRVISRADNRFCKHCAEFTLARCVADSIGCSERERAGASQWDGPEITIG